MSLKDSLPQASAPAVAVKQKPTQKWLLLCLLVLVLLIKVYFVMQTPLPAYDSYYGIRQVTSVRATGLPFVIDNLSYQGRITYEGIVFYMIMGGISFLVPVIFLFKYASIIFSLIALFLVYKIVERLVKQKWIALLATILAALSPSVFTMHLNTLLPSSLFTVLYLLLILFFFKSNKKQYITWFVIVLVAATLISSLTIVFIAGFALYFLLLKLESLAVRRREFELMLFSSVFVIWFHLLLYKPLLLQYGSGFLWKAIPRELAVSTFRELTPPLAIALIGIVPLFLGIYTIYSTLFIERNRLQLFLTSMAFLFSIVTWFGFLPLTDGLFYTTLTFILLSGPALKKLNEFTTRTTIPKPKLILLIVFFLLVLLNFAPVFVYQDTVISQAPTMDEANVFISLSTRLPEDAVVLGNIQEGHLITALMKRQNFYDKNFILAPQAQQRYSDAQTIYLSQSQTAMLTILQNYGVTHILISPLTLTDYPKSATMFANSDCFLPVYHWNDVVAYEITCRLKN